MREPSVRMPRLWLLLLCVGAVPWLYALGQAPSPPDEQGSRVKFGSVQAVDETPLRRLPRSPQPEKDDKKQPEKDDKKKKPADADKGGILLYAMPLTPPNPDDLFRLDSEEMFRDRLRVEARKQAPKLKLEFPEADRTTPMPPPLRMGPAHVKWVEPSYVLSQRLYFEQPHFERYGHSVGVMQPLVSTGIFGLDLLLWPVGWRGQPFRCYQVNTDGYSPYFDLVGN